MTPRDVKAAMALLLEPDLRVERDSVDRGRYHIRGERGAVWRGDDGVLRLSANFIYSDCAAALQLDYVPPMEPGVWSWLSSDALCPCGALVPAGWARQGYAYNAGSQCHDRRFVCAKCAEKGST